MTPLLSATLAFAAGLLGGFRLAPPPLALGAIACCALACFLGRGRATVALALAVAGLVCGGLRARAAAADCRERLPDGAVVRLRGVATSLPAEGLAFVVDAAALSAGRIRCRDAAIRVRVRASHHAVVDTIVRSGAAGLALRGRWMVYAPRNAWPRPPAYAGMLLVESVRVDTTLSPRPGTRLRIAQQARLRTLLPERWAAAEAMLLAQKAGLAPAVRARWVAAGLVHLLAISGMHVGLIAGGVIGICAAAGLPRRRGRLIALLVTAAYVLFLGAPSAALRALLQATLLLASLELQRPAEPFTALAAAALVILLIEPLALLDPGFQLSFAGMIGLIAWRRPIAEALPASLHRWLRDGIAAGVAASALTTPVAALHFGTASWIGIPATLIAAPVLAGAIALLVTALAASALLGTGTGWHAVPADLALRLLDGIAAAAAAVPGGHGHLAMTSVLYALLAAAALILARAQLRSGSEGRRQRRLRPRALRAALVAAAAFALLSWAPLLRSRGHIELHVIDVGQGDAIAVRSPRGRWLLVDTGPRTARFDAGRDRVVPYLLRRGTLRLDALVLTHPDADHIGGAEAVLDAFDVGLVLDPGFPAGKDLFIDLLGAARRSRVRWVAARAGTAFDVDGVRIELLYPQPLEQAAADANDNSVVFRLTFGGFAALFTGDAPVAVEEAIIARDRAAVRAQVLKVGHHGSRTSTGELLLQSAQPELALISAGRNNRYGHPNPGVLRRLDAHGVRVVRTDRLGSFVVRAAADGRVEVRARAGLRNRTAQRDAAHAGLDAWP